MGRGVVQDPVQGGVQPRIGGVSPGRAEQHGRVVGEAAVPFVRQQHAVEVVQQPQAAADATRGVAVVRCAVRLPPRLGEARRRVQAGPRGHGRGRQPPLPLDDAALDEQAVGVLQRHQRVHGLQQRLALGRVQLLGAQALDQHRQVAVAVPLRHVEVGARAAVHGAPQGVVAGVPLARLGAVAVRVEPVQHDLPRLVRVAGELEGSRHHQRVAWVQLGEVVRDELAREVGGNPAAEAGRSRRVEVGRGDAAGVVGAAQDLGGPVAPVGLGVGEGIGRVQEGLGHRCRVLGAVTRSEDPPEGLLGPGRCGEVQLQGQVVAHVRGRGEAVGQRRGVHDADLPGRGCGKRGQGHAGAIGEVGLEDRIHGVCVVQGDAPVDVGRLAQGHVGDQPHVTGLAGRDEGTLDHHGVVLAHEGAPLE